MSRRFTDIAAYPEILVHAGQQLKQETNHRSYCYDET